MYIQSATETAKHIFWISLSLYFYVSPIPSVYLFNLQTFSRFQDPTVMETAIKHGAETLKAADGAATEKAETKTRKFGGGKNPRHRGGKPAAGKK